MAEDEKKILNKVKEIFCIDDKMKYLVKLKERDLTQEKNIKENKNAETIVKENFSENFLISIPKDKKKIIVLGINPRWWKWK